MHDFKIPRIFQCLFILLYDTKFINKKFSHCIISKKKIHQYRNTNRNIIDMHFFGFFYKKN